MTLLYSKSRHFAKHKTICVTFLYKKPDTLRYAVFCGVFEIGEGGRDIFIGKNYALCVTFLYAKNNALCVTFLFTKSLTLCVTFLYAKTTNFALRFYI